MHKFYKVLKGDVTKVDTALQGLSYYESPTVNYIAYIQGGKVYIAHSLIGVPRQLIMDRLIAAGTDVAIAFKTEFIAGPKRKTLHRTVGDLQIFHVTDGTLYYRDGIEGSPISLATNVGYVSSCYGWVDILYGLEDQGLIVVYSRGSNIYYRVFKNNLWEGEALLHTAAEEILALKIQRTPDYRLAIMITTRAKKYMILTKRANIMRATQDTDAFDTRLITSAQVLSIKQPTTIRAKCLDNNTVQVAFDAPIVKKLEKSTHLQSFSLASATQGPIRCFTGCTTINDTTLRMTTDIDLGVFKDNISLNLIQSEYITTPGDTEVLALSTVCDSSTVAPVEASNIDILQLYNIT